MSKVVVVTGGGGVLCSTLAKALAKEGHKIAVLDLKIDAANEVAEQINTEGGMAIGIAANVLEKDSLENAKKEVNSQLGFCDILINGAGGNHPLGTTSNPYLEEQDLLNKEELHPYQDPLSSININYYDEGDALGWHFDNSDYTITLLVKNCPQGGVYEFFNDMRYKEGDEDYDFVEKILDEKIKGTKVDSLEGDLMIFKGNKSIHQVTAVEKGERILVTFNYNETKGISLSEQSRKTFFGRIK
jgi:hypothetical protein